MVRRSIERASLEQYRQIRFISDLFWPGMGTAGK